jgi:uncharacterized membrane protein YcaP (DUF421 family)
MLGGRRRGPAVNFLVPDIGLTEKVVRSVVVYGFLLVAFRLCGKRQLGQLTAFDLVVLLIISNVVQNAVIGDDNSLGGGLIGATTILLVNSAVAYVTFRFKRADRIIEHSPTLLVRHGRVLRANLRRERLGPRDLRAALRHHGVISIRDIRYAFLEEDGHVSVIARRPPGE